MDKEYYINGVNEFITVEDFKSSYFVQPPHATEEIGYILYKQEESMEKSRGNSLEITKNRQAFSAEIRGKKYNKIVKVNLKWSHKEYQERVKDKSKKFNVDIVINFDYRIRDMSYVYFERIWNFEDALEETINNILAEVNGNYGIYEQMELKVTLKQKLKEEMSKLTYLIIDKLTVSCDWDSKAKEIFASDIDTYTHSIITKNNSDQQIAEIKAATIVDEERNKAEIERVKRDASLVNIKLEEYIKLQEKYGSMASIYREYAEGKIDGIQLIEELRNQVEANGNVKIGIIKKLDEIGALEEDDIKDAVKSIVGRETDHTAINKKVAIEEKKEDISDVFEDEEEL